MKKYAKVSPQFMAKKSEIQIQENDKAKLIAAAIEIIKDRARSLNPPKMNISTIAKSLKVSRAWIYKNFGSSNDQIILTAIDIIAPLLVAPRSENQKWPNQDRMKWMQNFRESLIISLEQVELYPFLFRFYITHRLQDTKIGQRLAYHEHRFSSEIVRLHIEAKGTKAPLESLKATSEHLAAVRIGLIFKWLSQSQTPFEKKRQELENALKSLI